MNAEEMVDAALLADSAIAALTAGTKGVRIGIKGGLPDDQIFAPAVDYERVSTIAFDDLTSGGDIDEVRVQVDFWGRTAQEAVDLARLGREAISPRDSIGIGTVENSQGPAFDSEARIWRVSIDFMIMETRS